MKPDYFLLPERVERLRQACESWDGTPFRQRSLVKGGGGGVDCGGFLGSAFLESGAIDVAIAMPPYDLDHAEHSSDSLLRAWFEQPAVRARVRRVDEEEPHLDGDIVFPIVGLCEHHLGLHIGWIVYHVMRASGFARSPAAGLKLAPSRYRLIEP